MARTRQMLVGRVLVAIAAAGSTASLIVVYTSLRAVLSSGGFCAGGGAYAIAHQCDRSDTVLLLSGTLGMLTFGGLLAAATAWLRGPVMLVSLSLGLAPLVRVSSSRVSTVAISRGGHLGGLAPEPSDAVS